MLSIFHSATPSALIIQNSMKSVSIKAGEEFSLICEVNGRPTPTILWYKNNLQIKRQWFDYSYVNYGIRIINRYHTFFITKFYINSKISVEPQN